MKNLYRIIDAKGRVYLPKEQMASLGLEPWDLVKLSAEKDALCLRKVHLIEMGDLSPEAVEAYVSAASARMSREKQIELAARLLEQARKGVTP